MSPPESERSRILPTLTWESIVERGEPAAGTTPAAAPDGGASTPATTPDPPPPPFVRSVSADEDAGRSGGEDHAPVSLSLHLGDVSPVPPPPPIAPVGGRVASEQAEPFHLEFRSLTLGGDGEPTQSTGDDELTDAEIALPAIREATPVQPYISEEVPEQSSPTTVVAAIDSGATPLIPGSQPGPIVLPPATQPDQSGARSVVPTSPLAIEIPQRKPPSKRRGRTGLRLVMALVVLGAIVGGAIVFGRPYLFPDDWAANAKPYAGAVEAVVGAEFSEPVVVTAEPAASYQPRMVAQLGGDWETQLPTWRSLGLAAGDVTEASLSDLLTGWEPVMYSTTDGQIHHDDAQSGAVLDAELTVAMAMAWLDQEFGWAIGQSSRTLDGAAATSAQVLAQSAEIMNSSEHATELTVPSTGPLAYLPAVMSYEILAPHMYAPLLPPLPADGPNPLADLTAPVSGPAASVLADDALELAGAATLADGDTAVGAPAAMDRSFWYLVLAGFLDAPTAHAASGSIVESSLTVARRAGTVCSYATFSGGDLIQTSTLRGALESWVASAPPAMGATFTVGADGGLQLLSCDPGAQAAPAIRLGVATELIGWRSAELATVSGVLAAGGDEAEVAAALGRLAGSDVGAQLASASVDQSPTAAAAAARAAVEPIVTPPPPPAPAEPAD